MSCQDTTNVKAMILYGLEIKTIVLAHELTILDGVQGCVKTAGKGYVREKDLLKHSQEVHTIEE